MSSLLVKKIVFLNDNKTSDINLQSILSTFFNRCRLDVLPWLGCHSQHHSVVYTIMDKKTSLFYDKINTVQIDQNE